MRKFNFGISSTKTFLNLVKRTHFYGGKTGGQTFLLPVYPDFFRAKSKAIYSANGVWGHKRTEEK